MHCCDKDDGREKTEKNLKSGEEHVTLKEDAVDY